MKNCNPPDRDLQEIYRRIMSQAGYDFQDLRLLREALTHSSYSAEQTPPPPFNQRLEFLGDTVLQMILTDFLFQEMAEAQEGILTRLRALLAREESTAKFALALGLEQALLLGNGENNSGGRDRPSILGDAFEAFLGAIYLDGGLAAAQSVCLRLLPPVQDCCRMLGARENAKGALQEHCQRIGLGKPEYALIQATGPVHRPIYEMRVLLQKKELARGRGRNMRQAEQEAAAGALETLLAETECPSTETSPPLNSEAKKE